jgi:hypothetical protein
VPPEMDLRCLLLLATVLWILVRREPIREEGSVLVDVLREMWIGAGLRASPRGEWDERSTVG